MKKRISKNIQTVLDILQYEIKGEASSALKKMMKDYTMTWVYKDEKGNLFPRTSKDFKKELGKMYSIKGRKYDIRNIVEGRNIVMLEMIESYPDPKTKKIYRTPLVVILEMVNGKIKRGRHYCDPNLSYMFLTKKQVEKVFK